MNRFLAIFGVLVAILITLSSSIFAEARSANKITKRLRAVSLSVKPDQTLTVWVYFKDKGRMNSISTVPNHLTEQALKRRSKLLRPNELVSLADLPISGRYLKRLKPYVQRMRQQSRWLNAVSAIVKKKHLNKIQTLPYVKSVDVVTRLHSRTAIDPLTEGTGESLTIDGTPSGLPENLTDYGHSLSQLRQINVPAVHATGNVGAGVTIAVLDSGFNNLEHESLQSVNVIASHDFVNGDDDVNDGADMGKGNHGTWTLSALAGYAPGKLIGPAYGANIILAKTENTESETPFEEDNWIAALEWSESLGVDVISSSLGYLEFDRPNDGYSWEDMDGETTAVTRAATMAVQRGVVVVNAAGNSGNNSNHNTLAGPADGIGVIAVGAVNRLGARTFFSSVGPTVDGRIKPDVMALGGRVLTASPFGNTGYFLMDGTSFSCPLVAGVTALIIKAHPDWTPQQILDSLHMSASNAADPDNLIGWGIVDAMAAINYLPN